jgi:hypothetical protein
LRSARSPPIIEWMRKFFDDLKLGLISLCVFVAWLVAATGWVRGLAVVWLIYPAVVAARMVRRRSAEAVGRHYGRWRTAASYAQSVRRFSSGGVAGNFVARYRV